MGDSFLTEVVFSEMGTIFNLMPFWSQNEQTFVSSDYEHSVTIELNYGNQQTLSSRPDDFAFAQFPDFFSAALEYTYHAKA